MNAQEIAYLVYFISLSIVAPIIWTVFIPTVLTLIARNDWIKAILFSGIVIWSMVVWYNNFVVPIAYDLPHANPDIWDWYASLLVWPAAIFAVIHIVREWRRNQKEVA